MLDDSAVHILGGGIGGTVGAIFTCPLEVVKVRLQSSRGSLLVQRASAQAPSEVSRRRWRYLSLGTSFEVVTRHGEVCLQPPSPSEASGRSFVAPLPNQPRSPFFRSTIIRCILDIARTEGSLALFRGLIPTLIGVLPSRGIYFWAYHKGQSYFQDFLPQGSSAVFLFSAGFGSIVASTATCPIWYIKTRLQLHSQMESSPRMTVMEVIVRTWKERGFRGFYRGVTASYVGCIETALNFVVYENVKDRLLQWEHRGRSLLTVCEPLNGTDLRGSINGSKLEQSSDMLLCMVASGLSKFIAITLTYPHEVVRTRMREDFSRYRTFLGTLQRVILEDTFWGLYRGLGTHYVRQVPSTCLMLGTYEAVVFLLQSWGLTKKI